MTMECPECGQSTKEAICNCGYRFSRSDLQAKTKAEIEANTNTKAKTTIGSTPKDTNAIGKANNLAGPGELDELYQHYLKNKHSKAAQLKSQQRHKRGKMAESYLAEIYQLLGTKSPNNNDKNHVSNKSDTHT